MRRLRLRQSLLLSSTALGIGTWAIAVLSAPGAVPDSGQLLDPAYVAQQVCGSMQRKAEFFKPGALIAMAQAAAAEPTPRRAPGPAGRSGHADRAR